MEYMDPEGNRYWIENYDPEVHRSDLVPVPTGE